MAVDLYSLRARETGMPAHQVKPRGALQPLGQALDGLLHDAVLARHHRLHVHTHGAFQHDAVVRRTPRHMGRARAGHQRLGGRAAVVDAGAAVVLAFDENHFQA